VDTGHSVGMAIHSFLLIVIKDGFGMRYGMQIPPHYSMLVQLMITPIIIQAMNQYFIGYIGA